MQMVGIALTSWQSNARMAQPIMAKEVETMSGFSGTLYIPENDLGVDEGYYSVNQIVELLREHCDQPEVVRFVVDMMEI
jgi:hypothetical protein